jgi:acyl-CoA synthetase (AMP-forming)/AMP-acid ligase II
MLSHLVFEEALQDDRVAIASGGAITSWGQLRSQAQAIFEQCRHLEGRRIGLSFRPMAKSYATLAALARLRCDVFLLDGALVRDQALSYCKQFRLGAFLVPSNDQCENGLEIVEFAQEEPGSDTGSVTILTSGSTGEPKAARHSWEGLARPVRKKKEDTSPVWLLT